MKSAIVFCACLLLVPIASAQNNRSAVSVGGLDTNPCTANNTTKAYISNTLFEHTGNPIFLGGPGSATYSFGNNEFPGTTPTLPPFGMK